MKSLTILTLLFGLAVSVSGQPDKAANQKRQATGQGKPSVVTADSQNKQASGQTDQTEAGRDAPAEKASIERSHWWSTSEWWLVIIAGLTGCVIGWQSWETRKSANASKDAASAALLNAQTLINAERPWIVINVESPAPNQFHFKATNVGRTPARITAIYGHPLIVRRNRPEPTPDFEGTESLLSTPPCLLPSTTSCTALRCNIEELHGSDSVEDFLRYVTSGLFEIWFYGRVIYFDTLEPPPQTSHDTKWLFWYLPFKDALPIPDPRHPEYNTYI